MKTEVIYLRLNPRIKEAVNLKALDEKKSVNLWLQDLICKELEIEVEQELQLVRRAARASCMKYKAKKVVLDGHVFDSMAEAKHYWFGIKPRLEAGEIKDLRFQPVFRCEINGRLICKYIADFQYMDTKEVGRRGNWVAR